MQPVKSYHKENLRLDLLNAGRAFVEANGHTDLSIRKLAQQVGVSPGAPYHHFPDRRAFLRALAIDAFEELTSAARSISGSEAPNPDKLMQMGVSFIEFAGRNPRLVDLMYESELNAPVADPELAAYEMVGHTALRSAIVAERPDLSAEEADLRVIAFWSAIYGFMSMRKKGVIHASDAVGGDQDAMTQAIVHRSVVSALSAD